MVSLPCDSFLLATLSEHCSFTMGTYFLRCLVLVLISLRSTKAQGLVGETVTPISVTQPTFRKWLPEYKDFFQNTLTEKCLSDYQLWEKQNGFQNTTATRLVINCLLQNTEEWRKANMASAIVLIGSIPTVLGLTGSHVAEVTVVGTFRPWLAILVAYGAPVMNPSPALTNMDPLTLLEARKKGRGFRIPECLPKWMIVPLLYLLAIAAVANLVHTCRQFSVGTLFSFAPRLYWLPYVWWATAYWVFLAGALALGARIQCSKSKKMENGKPTPIWRRLRNELTTLLPGQDMKLTLKRETKRFIVYSWLNSVLVALHILFGTLMFSSALFVATRDALMLGGRVMVSHLLCRMIVSFELAGLRATVTADYGEEDCETVSERHDDEQKQHDSDGKRSDRVQVTIMSAADV